MIRPRYRGERGGTLTMSMKKNIPEPKHKDWKLTTCPRCGQQCWESELARQCLKKGQNPESTLYRMCVRRKVNGVINNIYNRIPFGNNYFRILGIEKRGEEP